MAYIRIDDAPQGGLTFTFNDTAEQSITVDANYEWTVSVTYKDTQKDWIIITPNGATGKQTVKIRPSSVNAGETRSATVTFRSRGRPVSIDVTQTSEAAAEGQIAISTVIGDMTAGKTYTDDIYIEGVVVTDMSKGNFSKGNLAIMTKDATTKDNGLVIYKSGEDFTTLGLLAGDIVRVNLKNNKAQLYRGAGAQESDPYVRQVQITNKADIVKQTGTATITPIAITHDQIPEYQGMLVKIVDAQSLDATTGKTWSSSMATYPFVVNGNASDEFGVFVAANVTDIAGKEFKTGKGSVVGIATVYGGNATTRSAAQIVPRSYAEVSDLDGQRDAGGPYLIVSESDLSKTAGSAAGNVTIAVSSNVAWTVAVTEGDTYVTNYTQSGSNDGTVTVTLSENASTTDDRTINLTVSTTEAADPASYAITITQLHKVVAGTNMVANYSFEDYTGAVPESWTIAGATATATKITENAQNGSVAIKLEGSSGDRCDLKQTIAGIEPGATYKLSFWYKDNTKTAGASGIRIWSNFINGTGGSINMPDKSALQIALKPTATLEEVTVWTEYTVDITAPEDAASFNFEIRATKSNSGIIDNCSLTKL